MNELPPSNRAIVAFLMRFLARVAQYSEVNKMSASNLGIVFAPNILRTRVETYETVARDTPLTIGVIKSLIEISSESLSSKEIEEEKEALLRPKVTTQLSAAVAAKVDMVAAITNASMVRPETAPKHERVVSGTFDEPSKRNAGHGHDALMALANKGKQTTASSSVRGPAAPPLAPEKQEHQSKESITNEAIFVRPATTSITVTPPTAPTAPLSSTQPVSQTNMDVDPSSLPMKERIARMKLGGSGNVQNSSVRSVNSNPGQDKNSSVRSETANSGSHARIPSSFVSEQNKNASLPLQSSSGSFNKSPLSPPKVGSHQSKQSSSSLRKYTTDSEDDIAPPPPMEIDNSMARVRGPSVLKDMSSSGSVSVSDGSKSPTAVSSKSNASSTSALVYSHSPPTQQPAITKSVTKAETIKEVLSDDEDDNAALPFPWVSHVDAASSKVYYYNAETNETTWDKPKLFAPLALPTNLDAREARRTSLNVHNAVLENIHNSLTITSTGSCHTVTGSWSNSNFTSGGAYPDSSWWQNPQYKLHVSKCPTTLKFSLSQSATPRFQNMGLMVVRVNPANPLFKEANPGRLTTLTENDEFLVMGPFREAQSLEVETLIKELAPFGDTASSENGFVVYIIPALDVSGKENTFTLNVLCDVDSTFECISEPIQSSDFKSLLPTPSSERGWTALTRESSWNMNTAGGCYPNFSSWRFNPQFNISLNEDDLNILIHLYSIMSYEQKKNVSFYVTDDGTLRVRAVARLARNFGDESIALGFYVFQNEGLSNNLIVVKDSQIISRSDYVQGSVVSSEFWLEFSPNILSYVLIPSTFAPSIVGSFTVNLFSPVNLRFDEIVSSLQWKIKSNNGAWTSANAGGCRNFPSWATNPQFLLKANKSSPVVIILSQDATDDPAAFLPIGFYVINKDGDNVGKGAFSRIMEVSCQINLDVNQAPYIIVPCTFDPQRFGNFTLMVYTPESTVDLSNVK